MAAVAKKPAAPVAKRPAAPAPKPVAKKPTAPAPKPVAKAPAVAAKPAAKAPAAAAPAAAGNAQVAKMLKQMKQKWEAAKEESAKSGGSGGTTAAAGRHECRLTDARLVTSPGIAAVLDFTVQSGDETGEKCVRYDNLDSDDRIVYFQRDLRRLGVDIDTFDIEQIPQLLEELKELAPLVRMTVKEKDGYLNAYIDKLLEEGDAPAEEEAAAEEEEAPAEEEAAAEEEAPAEEEAAAEEEETAELAIGSNVAYTDAKNKRHTGTVDQIYTDDTADIVNEKGAKENVSFDKIEILVETEE